MDQPPQKLQSLLAITLSSLPDPREQSVQQLIHVFELGLVQFRVLYHFDIAIEVG